MKKIFRLKKGKGSYDFNNPIQFEDLLQVDSERFTEKLTIRHYNNSAPAQLPFRTILFTVQKTASYDSYCLLFINKQYNDDVYPFFKRFALRFDSFLIHDKKTGVFEQFTRFYDNYLDYNSGGGSFSFSGSSTYDNLINNGIVTQDILDDYYVFIAGQLGGNTPTEIVPHNEGLYTLDAYFTPLKPTFPMIVEEGFSITSNNEIINNVGSSTLFSHPSQPMKLGFFIKNFNYTQNNPDISKIDLSFTSSTPSQFINFRLGQIVKIKEITIIQKVNQNYNVNNLQFQLCYSNPNQYYPLNNSFPHVVKDFPLETTVSSTIKTDIPINKNFDFDFLSSNKPLIGIITTKESLQGATLPSVITGSMDIKIMITYEIISL